MNDWERSSELVAGCAEDFFLEFGDAHVQSALLDAADVALDSGHLHLERDDLVFGCSFFAQLGDLVLGCHVLDDVREHLPNFFERGLLGHGRSIAPARAANLGRGSARILEG